MHLHQFHQVKVQGGVPAGIEVDDFGPDLTITRRWDVPFPWPRLTLCVAWNVFVASWIFIVTTQHTPGSRVVWWFPVVAAVPHAIIGACLAYSMVCCLLNRTVITISNERISIRHGPLPLRWNVSFPARDFQQLFCVEVARSRKHWPPVSYDLVAWNRDDSFDVLLAGLEDLSQAHFLEQRIERYLGLTKKRVPPGYGPRKPATTSAA
jgi:hypothetical protein